MCVYDKKKMVEVRLEFTIYLYFVLKFILTFLFKKKEKKICIINKT